MKKFSLQWRITLMTALLIGLTCIAMNLMLCSSGVYYMDRIADALRGGGTVIITDEGTASFDPQFAEPGEELTIVVDGVQGRFRTTNWYITAVVTHSCLLCQRTRTQAPAQLCFSGGESADEQFGRYADR
jgi:two-component system heavy metal sensor histidine kinase CusS